MQPRATDRGLLARLFESAGYRVEDRPAGVRFQRRRDGRVVFLVDGPRPPAEIEADLPSDAAHRTLIYSEEPGEPARQAAAERGIEVLDPTTVGAALGELLLPGPSNTPMEDAEDELGRLEVPTAVYPEGEHIVLPRLGRPEAESLAGVEGFRCTLRLVPFYVAPYRVREASAHGGSARPSEHLVAVQALQGRVEVWERGDRELTADLPEPHERLEPSLDAERALLLADEALRRRHTVSVDHTEQHGGTIVIERRRLPPGPDDLRVGPAALVHVPYWYIEGGDGRIVLDAVTGRRTESDPGIA
ncbi:MAG: hypothetical protein L3J73_05310 [Thermoplasmata archaeon]|nr:hypothetical protein [Thermoplasmata archaeon]